ncbi:hypothetical protein TNCV_95791 [Trichonephila clavipes]|nr:hypothetical protein TNCV_95791 [Trichonephila clavipes]
MACGYGKLSEKGSDDGELSCTNLNSDEDIRLRESDYEESEESVDEIDNIPVNHDITMSLGMAHNGYRLIVMFLEDLRLEMFCDKAVIQQVSRNIMSTPSFFRILLISGAAESISQVLGLKPDLIKDCVLGISQALGTLDSWALCDAGVYLTPLLPTQT